MIQKIVLRHLLLLFPSVFLMHTQLSAVKPITDPKEFHLEDERNADLGLFEKIALRKFFKNASNDQEAIKKLENGHWSLILSGVSIFLLFCMLTFGSSILIPYVYFAVLVMSFLSAIGAIVFGVKSRRNKKAGLKKKGNLAGIVGTIIGSIVSVLYLIVAIILGLII